MFAIVLPLIKIFAVPGAAVNCDKPTFFGLVPWYQYLNVTRLDVGSSHCTVDFTVLDPNTPSSFLMIGMAVLDDMLRVAALAAIGFVIFGGIQYITSQGSPEDTKKAQMTIINALIGLVIAIIAAGVVSFLGNRLGGK